MDIVSAVRMRLLSNLSTRYPFMIHLRCCSSKVQPTLAKTAAQAYPLAGAAS